MKLYTAYSSYFATGEGITHMVLVCHADDHEHMRLKFSKEYGSWYTIGVEITEGIKMYPLVLDLPIASHLLGLPEIYIQYKCQLHVNGS